MTNTELEKLKKKAASCNCNAAQMGAPVGFHELTCKTLELDPINVRGTVRSLGEFIPEHPHPERKP